MTEDLFVQNMAGRGEITAGFEELFRLNAECDSNGSMIGRGDLPKTGIKLLTTLSQGLHESMCRLFSRWKLTVPGSGLIGPSDRERVIPTLRIDDRTEKRRVKIQFLSVMVETMRPGCRCG